MEIAACARDIERCKLLRGVSTNRCDVTSDAAFDEWHLTGCSHIASLSVMFWPIRSDVLALLHFALVLIQVASVSLRKTVG